MSRELRMRVKFNRLLSRIGFSRDWYLIPLAAVIGALTGVVAVGFEWMVHTSDHFFFSHIAHAKALNGSLLLLMLLPAGGGLCVGLIQHYISRQPAGHGIPDVIFSLSRKRGVMTAKTGFLKAITSSLTIGSGGSAGVEGPIVQIGSVLGSVIGQVLRISKEHMNTLVGCGAAAGLAAIFNAPIAGVIFVLEVILRDFRLKTFMPIVVASVFGTAVAQATLGHSEALFTVHEDLRDYDFALREIIPYILLGASCGLLGVAFSVGLHRSEKWCQALKLHPAMRPAVGGALMGAIGIGFVLVFGRVVPAYEQPAFFANGYPVIEAMFNPASYAGAITSLGDSGRPIATLTVAFLLAALACKFVGTILTLGSGGSGGVFAPSLFMGATLGGAFGMIFQQFSGFGDITPATYALAGMAGMLAAAVHCPLSAFLLVFEVTQDYKVILPVMLVAILATTVAQVIKRDSIYTHALREHGIRIDALSEMTLLHRLLVRHVQLTPAVFTQPNDPASTLLRLAAQPLVTDFVVRDENGDYLGLVVGEDLRAALLGHEALPLLVVGDLMRPEPPTVSQDEPLDEVLDKFSAHDVASLPVTSATDDGHIIGMISRHRLMSRYQRTLTGT